MAFVNGGCRAQLDINNATLSLRAPGGYVPYFYSGDELHRAGTAMALPGITLQPELYPISISISLKVVVKAIYAVRAS